MSIKHFAGYVISSIVAMTMGCGSFTGFTATAENLDDTYMINPMLWADVPDPDVIRVGDYFYMVSTTMHLMPGCPVMRSTDLTNWEVISYVFDTLNDTPNYDLNGGTVYGKGQWATSLRYKDGVFYVLFSPNDQPYRSYIYKTTDPAGKWELICRTDHFHDSSLLLDDDGRVYVISGSGKLNLRELNPDLSGVKEDGVNETIIIPQDEYSRGLHEGSRAVKYNGKYYIMVIAWPGGGARRQLCYRADKITGPYERQVVLMDQFAGFPYLAQGTIVDDASGNWWGVIFQDRGGVGRVLTLIPCEWKDGWPMLGDSNGKVPLTVKKPVAGSEVKSIVVSDDFQSDKMNINWQWNHNPDNSLWSLKEKPGNLRLRTGKVVSNLYEAPNTLTQRMEGPKCCGTVKIDLSNMKDGDVAGFGAFNGHSGLLSVINRDGKKSLVLSQTQVNFKRDSKIIDTVDESELFRAELLGNDIYLRINADFCLGQDIATFAYSEDGETWNDIPEQFKMRFDYTRLFMGTKFAIYNYATKAAGGYVDVDYFRYNREPNVPTLAESTVHRSVVLGTHD